MVEVRECDARRIYGDRLAVAALGAIEKKPGSEEFRIIHDGSNGVLVNNRIRPRDQLRYPAFGDIQAVLHELAQEGGGHFQLLYDVHKAHRLIPVREEDWGFQACRIADPTNGDDEEVLWLNKVGTFGISSAAYWWGRVGALLLRLSHRLLWTDHAGFLYVDDFLFRLLKDVAPLRASLLCLFWV